MKLNVEEAVQKIVQTVEDLDDLNDIAELYSYLFNCTCKVDGKELIVTYNEELLSQLFDLDSKEGRQELKKYIYTDTTNKS